jgi:hypothetical protein
MNNRILSILLLAGLLSSTSLTAQETQPESQNIGKIRGMRFIPYPDYSGLPYLYDKFLIGEIELSDGTKVGNIGLRYSTYRDEIIYFNTAISAQIQIDKISLKGFSFTDEKGIKRIFRRQFYNSYFKEERFFEVLSDGQPALLAYRKVDLGTCDPSYNKFGLSYQSSYAYYMYSAEKGYSLLRLNRNSLLSKFDKPNQKLVKKLLRKNNLWIIDEPSFIKAWNLIMEKGITINFENSIH